MITIDPGPVAGLAVATAAGVLHRGELPRFEQALTSLLRTGDVVLLDVSDLRVPHTYGVTTFSRALLAAGGWPAARLVLVDPGTRLRSALDRAHVGQALVLADDLGQARRRAAQRPERTRRRTHLAPVPSTRRHLRRFIDGVSRDWDAGSFAADAESVAAALLAEVVPLRRTPRPLTVSRDRHGMHLAVRDFGRGCSPAERDDDRLDRVRRLSDDCGVIPRSDGSVVWARLREPTPPTHCPRTHRSRRRS